MALVSSFLGIFQRPTIAGAFFELIEFMSPVWIALLVGVFVGWAWKPKWANLNMEILDSTSNNGHPKPDDSLSPSRSMPSLSSLKLNLPSYLSWLPEKENASLPSVSSPNLSSSKLEDGKSSVNWDDFKHLHNLVEEKDGGPAWIQMMDRSTPSMSYQAWKRDPKTGPPQYRSRTVYEDATPDMLRDFFWDNEFRAEWDDMLLYSETLNECPTTGTMHVQWVRKFPFFCSDREYIIGRRIWQSGSGAYYCVTKGVPSSSVPRRSKPRRVDLYYSSWFIRAAESKRDDRTTACEVLLFHHEDMGIPWEIAKLGVRQGMWGAVKKIEPGLRAYQKHRVSGAPLSRSGLMAQVNTKVCADSLESLENGSSSSTIVEAHCSKEDNRSRSGITKMLVIGGAIALACSFDRGLLTKAVIFGVARRFANMGRRL